MPGDIQALTLIRQEAWGLLTRLDRIQPFALTETMVPAASVSIAAQAAIEGCLSHSRKTFRHELGNFIRWLETREARDTPVSDVHRRFVFLRLRFNITLEQLNIFSEVMTQRSEHGTGVLLAGLDVAATDALNLDRNYFEAPPVICYLQPGQGAAIRRARTRLPGGEKNPVAIVRIPRERMVGSGIASSLVHEVGHQGAAQLDLLSAAHPALQTLARQDTGNRLAWPCWERWVSEVISDLWSVARVGVAATLGLMGVVALPRAFVFRRSLDEVHPIPWIRVFLSCAMGQALYPDAQWARLAAVWREFYPPTGLDPGYRNVLTQLERTLPAFVSALLGLRPPGFRGASMGQALSSPDRAPLKLKALFSLWHRQTRLMMHARPSLAFAALAQARLDGRISPEEESRLLTRLLVHWAMQSTIDTTVACAAQSQAKALAFAS